MTAPDRKLYGPKQLALIAISGIIGIGFFLTRRYYEDGKLGRIEFIATAVSIAMLVTITAIVVRKGNREE